MNIKSFLVLLILVLLCHSTIIFGMNCLQYGKMKTFRLHGGFKGHGSSTNDIKFCPNGKYIVSTGQDETVKISNVLTGKCKKIFPYKEFRGMVVLSHNGKYAALRGNEKNIKLLDLKTGKYIKNFTGHRGEIKSMGFSHDDKYIVSIAEKEIVIKIWNIETGKYVKAYPDRSENEICLVVFSCDDKYVIEVGEDCTISFYDSKTGHHKKSKRLLDIYLETASLTNDCKYLAMCFSGKISIFALNVSLLEFEHVKTFKAYDKKSYDLEIILISFSPDNTRIAIASDKGIIKIFDRETYTCIKMIKPLLLAGYVRSLKFVRGNLNFSYIFKSANERKDEVESVTSLAFSPDNKYLAAGMHDGTVRVWGVFFEDFHRNILFLRENNIFVDTQIKFAD
ncbi:WD40 repeat domain-containing protein [Candidatus Dependentiae bacterium]